MIEKINNVSLNLDYYKGVDYYCDGSIEDEILEIVKTNNEDDFDKIIEEKNSWEIMYHLSKQRENIISWFDFNDTMTVLEIGSGCGAITGVLAQNSKKVTCIELSKKRSTINGWKNGKFNNIEIIVGNFQDIEPNINEKYDVVTLIGVLEYAESYIKSDTPYVEFLKIISNHLKKNGSLLIAIENKLGMKYWAGCKEDHVSKYYESIEGYTNSKGVKTFGKPELENLFKRAGFSNYKFYYPYPDYKFTETIFTDKHLPKVGELGNNLRNFDNNRIITFDEGKAFDTIIGNGLFPYYSNSFLVELKR
ncbi:MAG: class I SAM-dependent methyltransferase [Clostridia bacterium]|nr:class I SAM-dependent methyltransferase [Clostridia bacterium]